MPVARRVKDARRWVCGPCRCWPCSWLLHLGAALRRTARQLNRADGFQDGVERTAEHPGLLAGDDGNGVGIGEESGSGPCGFGGVAAALLRGDGLRHVIAMARVRSDAGADLAPRVGRLRIAGVERGHAGEVRRVFAGQRAHPREPPHVHSESCRGGRSCR